MATTKTKEEIQQFIIDTLLPYKEDKSNCGIDDGGTCLYLTEDGKMCAVGKHLKPNEDAQDFDGDVFDLDAKYNLSEILTDEANEYGFTMIVWKKMQIYHDNIATGRSTSKVNEPLEELEEKLNIDLSILKLD